MREPVRSPAALALALTFILSAVASQALASQPADGKTSASPSASAAPAQSSAAPAGWAEQVKNDLAQREYEVSWQTSTSLSDLPAAWQAPNRAQNLRTYFVDGGIRVVQRVRKGDSRFDLAADADIHGLKRAGNGIAGESKPGADEPAWEWGLSLIGYGRGGVVWPLPTSTPSASGNRVEYARGAFTEWYINEPRGLEQGFILAAPPEEFAASAGVEPFKGAVSVPGRGRDARPEDLIHIDLALEGDLSENVLEGGQAIDFVTATGARAIHYADLKVTDAAGRSIPAWMEGFVSTGMRDVPGLKIVSAVRDLPGMRGIRLVIDTRYVVWPITVDPLATSAAWTAEGDQANVYFGAPVATAGDVNGDGYSDVIVGALYYDNGETDEGRAFLYLGSASGLSTTPAWTAEGNQVGALFGYPVATAGDVNGDGYADVIVGAYLYDNTQTDAGRAYLYLGSATGLSTTPAWTVDGDQGGAQFGVWAATAGDVNGDGYADVVVGAWGYDNGQTDEGRAYVYLGSASGLSSTPAWTAESNQAGALFGYPVGTAGDVNGDGYADVVVGATHYDNGQTDEGRAYLYLGSASGLSTTPAWTVESDQAGAQFGFWLSLAGDVNGDGYADVIVGAAYYDNGQTDEGRAYVYLGSASGLSPTAAWSAESNQAGAQFGVGVSTAGDVNGDGYADVVVGAQYFDNGQTDEGRAYLYLGSVSGLATVPAWTAESDQAGAQFGQVVATAGDVNDDGYSDVLVAAPNYDNGQVDEGRVFLYLGSPSGLATGPAWTAQSDQADAELGWSVGTAGDVNGDGYGDVIVGAPYFDNGLGFEGRAFVYHGSAVGLSLTPSWTAGSDQESAYFGTSVATAGDVNGDGYADVIVGAIYISNGQVLEGGAFVYHGSAAGLSLTPNWTAESDQGNAQFGTSVSTAGDVNGDGYADVIVGAPYFGNGEAYEGRAFVYHGSAAGLSSTPNWTAESDQASANFGWSVETAGDVNGDGYSDVIVGAYRFDNIQTDEGRAFVYRGSAVGLSPTANWTAESDQASAYFGWSVGTAGDVNGDGYADVIVGTYQFDNIQTNEGRAFVYHGSSAGLLPTANWTADSDQPSTYFGYAVGTAGDVNGDGYADVIVGAPYFDNGHADEGRAFVYHGSAAGLSPTANWTSESDQAGAYFGLSVGTAGDVNGDGYADVIVGAPYFDYGQADEGRAFLYSGNGGAGLSLRPQQRRSDNAAPIAPSGASDSRNSFRLAALGRTPFGRGRVKLEWEVKPLGTPLDGTGVQTSPGWLDTGTAGYTLNEIVSGLTAGTVQHWRLRLQYHPAATPFQSRSRWFTVPWNGWQEGDFRTSALADLAVSQTDGADPILLGSGNLIYTLSITNEGPDGASVGLTDTLPVGSLFVGAAPSQGTCTPPASGVVKCALGLVASGGGTTVAVTVTPQAPGTYTNAAAVSLAGTDPVPSNNASSETTTVLPLTIGDRVWADANGNGIQEAGEPGVANVPVALYDGAGSLLLGSTLTDTSGAYGFTNLTLGATYRVRFSPPSGYVLTSNDQGADDLLDSDADPITQLTPPLTFTSVQDPFRWDAGLVPSCLPPDEPIFISMVTLSTDGNHYPILTYQDGNQPGQVTGYNVYRSSNPALPHASWPLVASNVIDMDEATPNKQWVDTSGDVPPGGVWYYKVAAFNARCPAEGPF